MLRNRLIFSGLEPILGHTEKLCPASYYIQISTNIKFYIRRKLFIITIHFNKIIIMNVANLQDDSSRR